MTARDHNKLLSIFYFVMAGLQLFSGIFIAIIYGIIGGVALSSARRDEDAVMGGVFLGVGIFLGIVLLIVGAFTLFTGFKVLREQQVGRTLGIIISILVLLSFPLGTALGIYGLWFFLGETGKNFYAGLRFSPSPPPPPGPSSWQ